MGNLSMRESPRAVLQQPRRSAWAAFERPVERLEAFDPGEIADLLMTVEAAAARGLTAVGFLSYEAAAAFDPALVTRPAGSLPLAWFALFETGRSVEIAPAEHGGRSVSLDWQPSIDVDAYRLGIDRIRGWIAAGDSYQVNYTWRLRAPFAGSASAYFERLALHGDSRYGAFIDTGRHALCSVSPELFFELQGDRLVTRPMKGTAERGRTTHEDAKIAEQLATSTKNRAENVMIVDMMRNDLGRIARPGTVDVSHLWQIERYATLFQMTSTCEASSDAPISEILSALFPSASITGAPKVRTMELIAELEDSPRGIYTGAIGRIGPGRNACFNVAIRTVHIDREVGGAEYGTGGGIVWDSVAEDEFDECRTKALVVTSPPPDFSLLETLRWDADNGFSLLERHLERLADSAAYFGRKLDLERLTAALEGLVDGWTMPQRVRLLVDNAGNIEVEVAPLPRGPRRWHLAVSPGPIDPGDRFLFHKTTLRAVYDAARASAPEADDVLLWNPDGELTESTLANLVVRRDGELLTPPVRCGLLPGTLRAELLARGRVREAVVRLEDLDRCDAVYLVNSVRGWIPSRLVRSFETLAIEPA